VVDPSHSADKFTLNLSRVFPPQPPGGHARIDGAGRCCLDYTTWREVARDWVTEVGLLTCERKDFLHAMRDEHVNALDSRTPFTPHPAPASDRRARGGGAGVGSTTPAAEWLVVAGPSIVKADGAFDDTSLPVDPAVYIYMCTYVCIFLCTYVCMYTHILRPN
jgi:hypothetical protein